MYNDDENIGRADLSSGAPSSENTDGKPEAPPAFGVNAEQPQPKSGPEIKGRPANPNIFYEPWQEPVYGRSKAPGQEPYSPGIHSGSYNMHQKAPAFEQPQEKKKKSIWPGLLKAVCLVLVCALAAGGATYGVLQFSGSHQIYLGSGSAAGSSAPASSDPADSSSALPGGPGTASTLTTTGDVMKPEDIYTMAVSQVVGVNSKDNTNVFGQATSSAVSGSGFIISSDGYVVTNYHVIQYAVEEGFSLTVITHDEQSYPAKVIGYEKDNDLAVIKVDATDLNAVTTGTNKGMKVGDAVYAVGNPLGELTYTMTDGIVSALDRVIAVDQSTSINMFQISAAVNPGNSGGPVYNDRGEVIGIVSAKYSNIGIEGLGFAIPIDDATGIVSQLITNGHVTGKPSMGVTVSTVTSAAAQYYRMVEGAYVNDIAPGSCADKAGIMIGDIIIKLGDTDVTSSDTLKAAKKAFKAGDTTTVVVNRDGKEISLSITFDEEGATPTAIQDQPSFSNPQQSRTAS